MKKKIVLGLVALVSNLYFGCSRTSDVIGPAACPTDAFAVTSGLVVKDHASGTSSLNMATSYADISASFNEAISYKVTITGSPSGAVYVKEGKSASIAFSWYGNSSNGKYFKKNDVVSVSLTNLCKTEPLGTATCTITTDLGYSGFDLKVINYEEGTTVSKYGDLGTAPYGSSHLITKDSAVYVASPQGGNYYKFRADSSSSTLYQDANGKNIAWYFGGSDFFATPPSNISILGTDPNKVYLNFFAKGQANSQAQMIITETVHNTPLVRKYLANVGSDWKLYSVRLADIGIIDPSAITSFSFNLGAANYQDYNAQVDLDLVIFTLDKPF